MEIADLAEELGGQHRPDPEQLQQGGVGLGDRGLNARLHRGDPLFQVAHVGHELGVSRQSAHVWHAAATAALQELQCPNGSVHSRRPFVLRG
jgi:hypothetical protein